MFTDEEDMIVIVVEDENYQDVQYETGIKVEYEDPYQEEYYQDQEYQEEEGEEMVLDEVTGEIISSKNVTEEIVKPPEGGFSEENHYSQNNSQSSISSDNHNREETITFNIPSPPKITPRPKIITNPFKINIKRESISNKSPHRRKHRNRQVPIEEAHSLVQELRDKNPALAEDKELLINHIAELMRDIKLPPIPEGYSRFIGGLYECSFCEKSSHTKLKSELHYLEIHGPRYLKCFSCGADFRCLPSLYRHERSCCHPDAGIVLQARALVATKGSKRAAIVSKVSKTRSWLMCEICQAVLSSKSSLEAHLCRHRNEMPYKCSLCTRSYTTRSSLVRHMVKHDEANKYECEQCQRVFRVRSMLISHLATHNKQWECLHKCGKFFATKASRNLHVDTKHLNKPMPCACNLCSFRCFNISLLRCHMEQRHGLIYSSDNSMIEQSKADKNSEEVTPSQPNNGCDSAETDQAVNHLKEVFYVTPNAENCIEVTTAPNDYYEIVLSSNEVNGLKEGYYEVITPKGEETKNVDYQEVIIEDEQEICQNECKVEAVVDGDS